MHLHNAANCNEFAGSEWKPDSRSGCRAAAGNCSALARETKRPKRRSSPRSPLSPSLVEPGPARFPCRAGLPLGSAFRLRASFTRTVVTRYCHNTTLARKTRMQEVHVDGADSAGLALAIRLAENMAAGCRSKVYVWDGRLRRLGLRGRRLGLIATAALAASSQVRRKMLARQ
jgi:hypothetical protein